MAAAKSLTVVAPLVIAKSVEGTDVYLYSGAVVPELAEGEVDRLTEGGFIKSA